MTERVGFVIAPIAYIRAIGAITNLPGRSSSVSVFHTGVRTCRKIAELKRHPGVIPVRMAPQKRRGASRQTPSATQYKRLRDVTRQLVAMVGQLSDEMAQARNERCGKSRTNCSRRAMTSGAARSDSSDPRSERNVSADAAPGRTGHSVLILPDVRHGWRKFRAGDRAEIRAVSV